MIRLILGDCLDVLRSMPTASVDAIIADPPAGISFMGKTWDGDKGGRDQWVAWLTEVMAECLRVVKPGGHALVWALPRTSHWTGWALESAGWQIRDRIAHQFYTGFPKSLDVSKALDQHLGKFDEREVVGIGTRQALKPGPSSFVGEFLGERPLTTVTAPATPEAAAWQGYGTALKPAIEDWWLCRAPLSEKTVAANVLRWGTGGLNIDACRYAPGDPAWPGPDSGNIGTACSHFPDPCPGHPTKTALRTTYHVQSDRPDGRWPANVYACAKPSRSEREAGLTAEKLLCHCEAWASEDQQAAIPADSGTRPARATTGSGSPPSAAADSCMTSSGKNTKVPSPQDSESTTTTKTSRTTGSEICVSSTPSRTSGSTPAASCGVASGGSPAASAASSSPSTETTGTCLPKDGRSTADVVPATSNGQWTTSGSGRLVCVHCGGWKELPTGADAVGRKADSDGLKCSARAGAGASRGNRQVLGIHPTVKPLALMRWLVRLVTPPGGTVVDPFCGSGTTIMAAVLEGFDAIGIEREPDYARIAEARIAWAVDERNRETAQADLFKPPEKPAEPVKGKQSDLFGAAPAVPVTLELFDDE